MRAALLLLVVAVAAQGALAAGKTPQAQPTAKAPSKAAAPTAKPAASKGKVGVRQQGDEYVDPAVLKEVFTSASPPTGEERAEEPISQEFICSVFGGPSCPEEQPNNVPCLCDSDEACQCVPYYQCDKNTGSVNQFGVGVIDIRQGNSSCPHYIYKCCKPSGPSKTPTDTYPEEPRPPQTESSYKPTDSFTEAPYQPPENHPNPPDYNPNPNPNPPDYNPNPNPTDNYNPNPPDYNPNPTDNHNPSPPDNNYNPETPSNGLPPSPPGRPRCGQRNPEGIGVRITGDEDGEAQFGEFPWMVAILKVETSDDEKKRNLYQCGGALITPQVVLTAAHCVKNRISSEQLKVRAGEWDTQTSKEMYRHQDVGVEEVVVHPDYYAGAVHNDIALLFLSEAVHIGYHIGTICMPEQDQNFDYNKCFVSGWGKDTFGQQGRYQVILKKLELPVVPNDQCQEQLRKTRLGNFFVLHHSFICAGGEEGKDTCKGDGGSPLVCPMPGEPGRYQLAGTVAWGIDCGLAGVPGVYGNVPLFRNWVDDQLRMHNIDDTPYLP